MTDFAGWEMPIQYRGILEEHRAVREDCGVFDISHMGEFFVRGPNACEWLDTLLTNRVSALGEGEAHYSLLLNERAGIIDDLIVYKTGVAEFLLVVNAARIEEDFAWLERHRSNRAESSLELVNCSEAYAALAVQGPRSPDVFAQVFASKWDGRRNRIMEFEARPASERESGGDKCGSRVFAATTGYTGETGFEAIVPASEALRFWDLFVSAGAKPCGLGARDTLRLEMCFPLNGSDLLPECTPLEAGLGYFVDLGKVGFVGRERLLAQQASGLPRRLSAIRVLEKSPPIRAHYTVVAGGQNVAETTSGALSPSLGCGIALAYLPFHLAKVGQELEIRVRERAYRATVVKKPFYKP
jgi:aminomethyltransferase